MARSRRAAARRSYQSSLIISGSARRTASAKLDPRARSAKGHALRDSLSTLLLTMLYKRVRGSATCVLAKLVAMFRRLHQILYLRGFSFADFRRRTPGPPPFSSMNSTPANSKARRTTSSVARRGWLPSFSNWWIVMIPTLARSAKFCWLQLSKPRAALHWADVIIPKSSATR
jgi:hypothetical protein